MGYLVHWYGGWCVHGPYHGKKLAWRTRQCFIQQLNQPITFGLTDTPLPEPQITTLGFYNWNDLVEEWHWIGRELCGLRSN